MPKIKKNKIEQCTKIFIYRDLNSWNYVEKSQQFPHSFLFKETKPYCTTDRPNESKHFLSRLRAIIFQSFLSYTDSLRTSSAAKIFPEYSQKYLHAGYAGYGYMTAKTIMPCSVMLKKGTSRLFTSSKGAKRTRKSERSKLQRGCAATERAGKPLPTGPGCSKLG